MTRSKSALMCVRVVQFDAKDGRVDLLSVKDDRDRSLKLEVVLLSEVDVFLTKFDRFHDDLLQVLVHLFAFFAVAGCLKDGLARDYVEFCVLHSLFLFKSTTEI